jgi:hypothetical protein
VTQPSSFERGGPVGSHTVADLRSAVRKLLGIIAKLRAENTRLQRDNDQLRAANEWLARQVVER